MNWAKQFVSKSSDLRHLARVPHFSQQSISTCLGKGYYLTLSSPIPTHCLYGPRHTNKGKSLVS
jgi:hypothetical protein